MFTQKNVSNLMMMTLMQYRKHKIKHKHQITTLYSPLTSKFQMITSKLTLWVIYPVHQKYKFAKLNCFTLYTDWIHTTPIIFSETLNYLMMKHHLFIFFLSLIINIEMKISTQRNICTYQQKLRFNCFLKHY